MTQREVITTECIVIGAGVVGLAVAEKLSKKFEVLLFEKNKKFGEETSSRNSEVIHSGIHHPLQAKKTQWCIEGRRKLYEFCEKSSVPFKKLGKYIVATDAAECEYLERKESHCREVGVPFTRLSGEKAKEILPYLRVAGALYFPETGIIDSHVFMQVLEAKVLNQSTVILYQHRIKELIQTTAGWEALVDSPNGILQVKARFVVNCAGLTGANLSNEALGTQRYEHRYCRGRYFTVNGFHPFNTLIYPVPPKDGLGVHVTLDMSGALRLGPDVDWSPIPNYECDWDAIRQPFAQAAKRYWPELDDLRLSPGLIGIRPKLFIDGKAYPDFLVEEKEGFIHCLGIESPGLTSALAIADFVFEIVALR